MKNEGKKFEEDFKNSIITGWVYRFKDGTGNFAGTKNENVRFQASNICDFLIYANDKLFLCELKSYKGTSIPFTGIRPNQLKELIKAGSHEGIEANFIFNFRDKEETYIIAAEKVQEYIIKAERKSIPYYWAAEVGELLKQEKKIKRYRYDIDKYLKEA